ncbi:protein GRIP isoform X3 [Hordeum vulgare subsp. vulgare]|uniref:protein GRIP isoform X3 n=1 Tax=Hordeum vulgare subsp. vulgare TaxID=112509 RepID=UPI001D1A4983|nr:protein GRIP isoform X3 [Hordeum vulgare subsp. vulgare]
MPRPRSRGRGKTRSGFQRMDPEEGIIPPAPEQAARDPTEEESTAPVDEERADTAALTGEDEGASENEAERTREELERTVTELSIQNEYLKSQIAGAQQLANSAEVEIGSGRDDDDDSELVRSLKEQVERLSKEVQEQKQTQKVAEAALEHVNTSYAEADVKAQELTAKLNEAQLKIEKELKERDDKYVELDTKFQRLHKRAKNRIQDIQKEKDDLEARFNEINQKAMETASLQLAAQQELERVRHQASEALRAMDAERQQLRAVNNKLRCNFDETRLALEARNSALEKLQLSMLEKEQMLEQIQRSMHSAEDKRLASVSELSAKHHKQLESLEAQLAEVSAERTKASETIQSLQMVLAEKDSEITGIEAVSTGEAARLNATLEEIKGELAHLKDQHEKERQSWEAECESLREKLEASEDQLESELSTQNQLLQNKDSDVISAKEEIGRLESEFSAYKIRAHALLQRKDAELSAAQNSDVLKAHEEEIREAEKEVAAALEERDEAIQDLQAAQCRHSEEIEARDLGLAEVDKKLKNVMKKLDYVTSQFLSEKESWQKKLASVEESWRLKCESMKGQSNGHFEDHLQKNLGEWTLKYEKLKEEHESFRDISDRMIEEKEQEIAKLLNENKDLHHSLEAKAAVSNSDNQSPGYVKQDALSIELAEQQILLLARQQAQREEELGQSQRHILALQVSFSLADIFGSSVLSFLEAMLKAELRNMERSQKREGIDMTYLKNVILKLLETGEVGALLPVVAMLLQFSPDELNKCQHGVLSNVASPPATALSDGGSTPNSFFGRFTF